MPRKEAPPALVPAIAATVFEHAVEQADIAITITDTAANILYVNPAYARLTGYAHEELLGRNQSILSNKTTPAAVYAAMWAEIAAGRPWSGQLVNRRKDGSKYLADLLITPVLDDAGAVVNFLGIHRDVTPLHRLECEVANQKALIESVVDSVPIVIALLDGEDSVVLDNHEYKKLMGDLRMAEPATLLLDAIRADLGHGLGTPKPGAAAFAEREVRLDRPGWPAPRWFSCSGVWVERADGEADAFFDRQRHVYLLLAAQDVTRRRAEQEKARMAALNALMAETARIDALRETLSAAIFQIEGPLNVMASVTATFNRRGDPAPGGGALAEAVRAGLAAVDNLRRAIPQQADEPANSTSLNEVLRDVLQLSTGRLLAAGITVDWRPQAVLPNIHGHANRLRTLFMAIVDNAIDAMNARGRAQRELRIATASRADGIEVTIDDSGPGIAVEDRLKVFEPFWSTRRDGRHPGMGLTSAQQVAQDHGGTLEIGAAPGGGCRVRASFPLAGALGEWS